VRDRRATAAAEDHDGPVGTSAWIAALAAGALGAAAPVAPAPQPPPRAATVITSVEVVPRLMTARPGFHATASGPKLNAPTFTTVAAIHVAATRSRRTVVLFATLTAAVPMRIALSVVGVCRPDVASQPAIGDELVIGQNPVPGSSAVAVASRTVFGRAVVDIPALTAMTCALQVSPRTESTTPSWLRLTGGRFAVAPAAVFARAAQRRAVLVGTAGAQGRGATARNVAVVAPAAVPDGAVYVRADGEVELTTCALAYHLCGRGTSGTSVVDLRLHLELWTSQGVCRRVDGPTLRVAIDAAMHHRKALLLPITIAPSCPSAALARLWIVATSVRGDAVEVEPLLGTLRAQTHAYLVAGYGAAA
jgi:hypothetical protein